MSDLEMVATQDPAELIYTRKRTLTRRGVMWLGQTCNLRCHFCYFIDRITNKEHPEHPFMSLEKAKKITSTLVDFYGNNAIDIQGGEPTIYPDIAALITHCREIGLYPTLITNGIALARIEVAQRLHDAGIRDYLFSLQGLGEDYDTIVGVKGGAEKQRKALDNLQQVGTPVRFNCVLSKLALKHLPDIARLTVEKGVRAINFLTFNPFEDQSLGGKRSTENVPTYSDVVPQLTQALDILEEGKVEANVRYFPLCLFEERHRKSAYNWQQLPYDHHEWDYASWNWTTRQPQRMKGGETDPPVPWAERSAENSMVNSGMPVQGALKMGRDLAKKYPSLKAPLGAIRKAVNGTSSKLLSLQGDKLEESYRNEAIRRAQAGGYVKAEACQKCALRNICDGVHVDYAELFGTHELRPILELPVIQDSKHYISQQDKSVEAEDRDWAL